MTPSTKKPARKRTPKKKEPEMAATEAPVTDAPTTDENAEKVTRQETTFRILSRAKGEELWRVHDETVDGRTQDEGKKRAAVLLGAQDAYRALIEGDGLELAVTSARSFKPQLVKVEPQPAKVVIR